MWKLRGYDIKFDFFSSGGLTTIVFFVKGLENKVLILTRRINIIRNKNLTFS